LGCFNGSPCDRPTGQGLCFRLENDHYHSRIAIWVTFGVSTAEMVSQTKSRLEADTPLALPLIGDRSPVTELQVTACVFGWTYAFHLIAEGLTVCLFSGGFCTTYHFAITRL